MTPDLIVQKSSKISITISLLIGAFIAVFSGGLVWAKFENRVENLESTSSSHSSKIEKGLELTHGVQIELAGIKSSLFRIEEALKN